MRLLSLGLNTEMVLKNRAGPPADPDGFGTRNGKVQKFLGKIGQSFRPGREAGCFRGHVPEQSEKNWAEPPAGREARKVTGDQIGKGGDEAPLQRDIPVS